MKTVAIIGALPDQSDKHWAGWTEPIRSADCRRDGPV